jgi:hypothetical protein
MSLLDSIKDKYREMYLPEQLITAEEEIQSILRLIRNNKDKRGIFEIAISLAVEEDMLLDMQAFQLNRNEKEPEAKRKAHILTAETIAEDWFVAKCTLLVRRFISGGIEVFNEEDKLIIGIAITKFRNIGGFRE